MKNIITMFSFSLGFLTFSWWRASQTEKSEILWALHPLDGISGGSSTTTVWIFSESALPSYYPITLNFVKSHAKKFHYSFHCLCALLLQKIGTSVSCGSGVYDWFIIAAPLKSNSFHLLGKTDCQTISLFSLSVGLSEYLSDSSRELQNTYRIYQGNWIFISEGGLEFKIYHYIHDHS